MSYENIDDNGRIVTNKKTRLCEWCGSRIGIGEPVVVRVYMLDDEFNSGKMHPDCYNAMKDSFSLGLVPDGTWEPGDQERGCLAGDTPAEDAHEKDE